MSKGRGATLAVVATLLALACGEGREVKVILRRGESAGAFSQSLARARVISSPTLLLLLMKAARVDRKLQPGRYTFREGEGEFGVVGKLVGGMEPELARLRVPEGSRARDICALLADTLGLDVEDVLRGVTGAETLDTLVRLFPALKGAESVEGFLFPDTYEFNFDEEPRAIAIRLVRRFFEVTDTLGLGEGKALLSLATVASIVELEAGDIAERRLVAGVLENRLRLGIPLAVNSTLGYVLDGPVAWLTREQLSIDSPYNTYKRTGLPPTPVCSPSLSSLAAAKRPARTPYLYFVANGEGRHLFARTAVEHERNVAEVRGKWGR